MKKQKSAELHLHTKLSDGMSTLGVEDVLEGAVESGYSAVAFTNLNSVQDFPKIQKAAPEFEKQGIKVIYGAELRYCSEQGVAPYGVTVLAKNQEGIKELYRIISSIKSDGVCELCDLEVLKQNRKNLLVGSCGNMGELYDAVKDGQSVDELAAFYDYFELYPTIDPEEQAVYKRIFELGEDVGVLSVAVGNCRRWSMDDTGYKIISSVTGRSDDEARKSISSPSLMQDFFSYLGKANAKRVAVDNPLLLASFIDEVKPIKQGLYLPKDENAFEAIAKIARSKAAEIYGKEPPEEVSKRLETELACIHDSGSANIYLIYWQLATFVSQKGFYVGNRGSVGSSLVAFLLGITDQNPLPPHYYCPHCHHTDFSVAAADGFDLPKQACPVCKATMKSDGHNLPHEVFMGYDGSKLPDIDLTYPLSQEKAVECFLVDTFGEDRLIRCGRVLEMLEHIAEEYIILYEAKTGERLSDDMREYAKISISGTKRGEGCHPCGVFILPKGFEPEDFTPTRPDSEPSSIKKVSHIDFHHLQDSLLKLDVLGHSVPDLLRNLELATKAPMTEVDWSDQRIYELFSKGNTRGIHEFESDFMRKLLLKTQPKAFSDLVAICGLSHGTGTWNGNGEKLFEKGCSLNQLASTRDTVMLQLMGYGLDRKNAFIIAEYARKGRFARFNERSYELQLLMREKKVPEQYIDSLSRIVYLFPKAHAVTYTMNAVRLAWYKLNFPREFYNVFSTFYDLNRHAMPELRQDFFEAVKNEGRLKGFIR